MVDTTLNQIFQADLNTNVSIPFLGGGSDCFPFINTLPTSSDGSGTGARMSDPVGVARNPFNDSQLVIVEITSGAIRVADLRDSFITTVIQFDPDEFQPWYIKAHPLVPNLFFVSGNSQVRWVRIQSTGVSWGVLAGSTSSTRTTHSPDSLFTQITGSAVSFDGRLLYVGDGCRLQSIALQREAERSFCRGMSY